MLPVYIILHLFNLESHFRIYILWLKVIIVFLNFGVTRVMQLILKVNHIDSNKQKRVAFLYLISPFVQFFSIGMGQIDVIGFFALLCFLSLQKTLHTIYYIYDIKYSLCYIYYCTSFNKFLTK